MLCILPLLNRNVKQHSCFGAAAAVKELYKMLPYVVTLVVLIIVSLRKKREDQPPASLGLSYFREER